MTRVTRIKPECEVADWDQGGESLPSVIFDLAVDSATLAADIADYDPASGTSPSVSVARKYARAIFDAWLAAQQAGG